MGKQITSAEADDLEALIDRNDLAIVVNLLGIIARQKAEHIRENWQDASTARLWDRAAGVLETAARRVSV